MQRFHARINDLATESLLYDSNLDVLLIIGTYGVKTDHLKCLHLQGTRAWNASRLIAVLAHLRYLYEDVYQDLKGVMPNSDDCFFEDLISEGVSHLKEKPQNQNDDKDRYSTIWNH